MMKWDHLLLFSFHVSFLPSFLPPEKWDVAHHYSRLQCSLAGALVPAPSEEAH